MLKLKNIDKSFNLNTVNEISIFKDFNFIVNDGEFISIIGSNGSGKTTLLNLICGSSFPERGYILEDDIDITKYKEFDRYKNIGRVFQDPSLGTTPSMTILENLSMADNKGRKWGLKKGVNDKKIEEYREMLSNIGLGLENKLYDKVKSLSGGQRQALSLLMASMTPIKYIILDEHTASLDPKTADKVMELTEKIVRENNLTALMVTHNLKYALNYGNRLVMMHRGEVILDKKGKDKENMEIDDILGTFNKISIEYGNSI